MTGIPVERVIGDSYRFVFRNILSIFGIVWLPMVLMAAAVAAVLWTLWPDLAGLDWSSGDLAHKREIGERLLMKVFMLAVPLEIVIALLFVMIVVGIQRRALGLIEGPVYAFFSLGRDVWRLFFGMLLAFLLVWLSTMASVAATFLIFRLGRDMPAIYGLVEFVAVIACICWFFYLFVRLTFFIPPATVAEGGLGLGRSWALGRGNFWRIVVVILACVVGPSIVISMVSEMTVWPFMMAPMLRIQQAAEGHQVLPPDQVFSIFAAAFRQILPLWAGFHLVTFPIAMGLSGAMSAFAYKHLTAPEAEV
jgi:hypothetical protein